MAQIELGAGCGTGPHDADRRGRGIIDADRDRCRHRDGAVAAHGAGFEAVAAGCQCGLRKGVRRRAVIGDLGAVAPQFNAQHLVDRRHCGRHLEAGRGQEAGAIDGAAQAHTQHRGWRRRGITGKQRGRLHRGGQGAAIDQGSISCAQFHRAAAAGAGVEAHQHAAPVGQGDACADLPGLPGQVVAHGGLYGAVGAQHVQEVALRGAGVGHFHAFAGRPHTGQSGRCQAVHVQLVAARRVLHAAGRQAGLAGQVQGPDLARAAAGAGHTVHHHHGARADEEELALDAADAVGRRRCAAIGRCHIGHGVGEVLVVGQCQQPARRSLGALAHLHAVGTHQAHQVVLFFALLDARGRADVAIPGQPVATEQHEAALVAVGMAFGVGAADEVGIGGRRVPGRAHHQLARARTPVGSGQLGQRGRGQAGHGVQKVAEVVVAVAHARHAGQGQRVGGHGRKAILRVQGNQRLQVLSVVVEQRGGGIARVVAGGRQTIQRGHQVVQQVGDGIARVRRQRRDALAGGAFPHVVQLPQLAHGRAVAGAFAGATTLQLAVEGGDQLVADLVGAKAREPGLRLRVLAVRGQAQQHGGAQEGVVVVVGRVVDRPARPGVGLPTPLRCARIPDVPDRLVGIGHPAGALLGCQAVPGPVVDGGQAADDLAHGQVAVAGHGGALAIGNQGLFTGHEGVGALHRVVGIARLAGGLVDEGGKPGLEAVDVAAGHLRIDIGLHAQRGRRAVGHLALQAVFEFGMGNQHARMATGNLRYRAVAARDAAFGQRVQGRKAGGDAARGGHRHAAGGGVAATARPAVEHKARRRHGPQADHAAFGKVSHASAAAVQARGHADDAAPAGGGDGQPLRGPGDGQRVAAALTLRRRGLRCRVCAPAAAGRQQRDQ